MSQSREKKTRYCEGVEFFHKFECWLEREPPMWKFLQWHEWRSRRPPMPKFIVKNHRRHWDGSPMDSRDYKGVR